MDLIIIGLLAYPTDQAADTFALDGAWTVETQFATQFATPTGPEPAGIRLDYHAAEVRMVLAGEGSVRVRAADGTETTLDVTGTPRSYEIARTDSVQARVVTVDVDPGVEVY